MEGRYSARDVLHILSKASTAEGLGNKALEKEDQAFLMDNFQRTTKHLKYIYKDLSTVCTPQILR